MPRTKAAPALTRDAGSAEIHGEHERLAKSRVLVDVTADIAEDIHLECVINLRARR